jgi:hypothetical protein
VAGFLWGLSLRSARGARAGVPTEKTSKATPQPTHPHPRCLRQALLVPPSIQQHSDPKPLRLKPAQLPPHPPPPLQPPPTTKPTKPHPSTIYATLLKRYCYQLDHLTIQMVRWGRFWGGWGRSLGRGVLLLGDGAGGGALAGKMGVLLHPTPAPAFPASGPRPGETAPTPYRTNPGPRRAVA